MNKDRNDYVEFDLTDPLDLPGDLKKAIIHGRAQKILNINNYEGKEELIQYCECCQLPCEYKGIIQPFPICVDIKELSVVGCGTYLYLYFFKYISFVLIITGLIVTIPQMVTSNWYYKELVTYCNQLNITNVDCHNYYNNTSVEWLYSFSYENSLHYRNLSNVKTIIIDYTFLILVNMILLLITNATYITVVYNKIIEIDYYNVTPSDYTLLISDIPKEYKSLKEIENKLLKFKRRNHNKENELNEDMDELKPIEINPTYKIKEFTDINNRLTFSKKKYYYCIMNNKNSYKSGMCNKIESIQEIKNDIIEMDRNMDRILDNIEGKKSDLDLFNGILFAVFKNGKDYETFYKKFPNSYLEMIIKVYLPYILTNYFCRCCFKDETRKKIKILKTLRVEKAPEPNDIIWENLEYSYISRLIRIFLVFLLSFILIVICFLIVIFLTNLQKFLKPNKEGKIDYDFGISMLISLSISVINYIISICLRKISEWEKRICLSEYQLTMAIKLSIFTFINSAVVPLVSNVLVFGNSQEKEILIKNVFTIFIFNAVLSPLIWISNYWLIYLTYLRSKLTQKYLDELPIKMSQRELNSLFENPSVEFSYKLSFILKTVLMTFFYLPILPIGLFISLFGLIVTFHVEKLNLIKFYKRPEMPNEKLVEFFLDNFKLVLFVYSVGNYIFLYNINYKISLMMIIFFSFLSITPFARFFKIDLVEINESEVNKYEYDDVYFEFNLDYERANPITRRDGIEKYVKKLLDKNFITKDQYEKVLERIKNKKFINLMKLYYKNDRISISDNSQKSESDQNKNLKENLINPNKIPKLFKKRESIFNNVQNFIKNIEAENSNDELIKRNYNTSSINSDFIINQINNNNLEEIKKDIINQEMAQIPMSDSILEYNTPMNIEILNEDDNNKGDMISIDLNNN